MPKNAEVFIHFGPYESCWTVDHHLARLQGLKYVLEADNHVVHTVQTNDWNCVEIWVNGERIYACDIRELDYGGDGQLDGLCSEALIAVQTAF